MATKHASFAGSWYPGSHEACTEQIEQFLASCAKSATPEVARIGGIVPHAGWYFSGEIACAVFNAIKSERSPDVVVIFGSHLGPTNHHWIMMEGAWQTPLGDLPVHVELAQEIARNFRFGILTPSANFPDNTIELQLPFVKYFFPEAAIVPMGVAPNDQAVQIGAKTAELIKQKELAAVIVGSTDLTHYGPNYAFTPQGMGEPAVRWVKEVNDKKVCDFMVKMDANGVLKDGYADRSACCAGGAAAAIGAGVALGATDAELLVYTTSYDVRPDASFVGYAGVVF